MLFWSEYRDRIAMAQQFGLCGVVVRVALVGRHMVAVVRTTRTHASAGGGTRSIFMIGAVD